MKGADVVMSGIVQYNDWLEEEVQLAECCAGLWVGREKEGKGEGRREWSGEGGRKKGGWGGR
jgi:hypothetical protein